MDNTAENQYTLLKLIVNTVALGNYTQPNMNAVPGILAPGTVNGVAVNLAPFFTGTSGATTNRGGQAVAGVNFLDGGGAAPLMNNTLPPMGTNQYTLVTHLYQYFGYLLGCSMMGTTAFPAYGGSTSQYSVHKYMYLTTAQNTYFINQVALSAQSFGVASADIAVVGTALNSLFNQRCSANVSVPMSAPAAPQAICIADDCALAANSSCAAYQQTAQAGVGPNSTVVNAGVINLSGGSASAASSGHASSTRRASSTASRAAGASATGTRAAGASGTGTSGATVPASGSGAGVSAAIGSVAALIACGALIL